MASLFQVASAKLRKKSLKQIVTVAIAIHKYRDCIEAKGRIKKVLFVQHIILEAGNCNWKLKVFRAHLVDGVTTSDDAIVLLVPGSH